MKRSSWEHIPRMYEYSTVTCFTVISTIPDLSEGAGGYILRYDRHSIR